MANVKKISLLEFFALELSEAENPQTKRPKSYYSQTVRRNSTGPDAKEPEKYDPAKDKVSKEKPWKVEHCEEDLKDDLDEAEQLRAAHAEGDSKWSDPFAGKERMPHEEPHSEAQGRSANAWKDQRPCQKVKDFFGGEAFPKRGKVDEAEDPKKPGVGSIVPGQAKQDLPDELPDDDEFDWDEFHQSMADAEKQEAPPPAAPGEEPEPWDDVTSDQIAKQTVAAPPPGAPKQRDVWRLGQQVPPAPAPDRNALPPPPGIQEPSEDDMTWDEFRAVEPDPAADLERETSPEELQGGHFQKRDDGRMYFISASGVRWGYLGNRYGWEEMDFDGETPDGGVK